LLFKLAMFVLVHLLFPPSWGAGPAGDAQDPVMELSYWVEVYRARVDGAEPFAGPLLPGAPPVDRSELQLLEGIARFADLPETAEPAADFIRRELRERPLTVAFVVVIDDGETR
jgi:hypothetical protein